MSAHGFGSVAPQFAPSRSLGISARAALFAALAGLAGCATGNSPTIITNPPAPVPTAGITVNVAAGSTAISGASVQFYAAGSAGNGSKPTALLTAPLTTSSAGSATIPASAYTCPSSTAQVYLYATGGTLQGSSSANGSIALLSAIGTCSALTTTSNVLVNEITTVAAIDALAPFYGSGGAIGASATNLTGLTNAFATAGALANNATGRAPGASMPTNVVLDANRQIPAVLRVNSVANLLNLCVTSAAACSKVFSAVGGTVNNTADAVYQIAANPGAYTNAVYAQAVQDATFSPVPAMQPTDYTVFLSFSGGGMNVPTGLGVDASGNVWVASYFQAASKFNNLGTPIFANGITGNGLNNSYGLAVDLNNNAWIPNEQPYSAQGIGSVSALSPTGSLISGAAYTAGGFSYPLSVAIDPNGTVWTVDYGNSHLTLLNSSGVPISGATGYTTPLFAFPVVVAVDGNHFGWVANQADVTVTKVAPDGSSFQNFSCCNGASGIAIDAGNNVWVANYYGDSVSMISSAGVVVSNGAYKANGSIAHPQGIALDGVGHVWVANYRAPYLTELAGATASVPGAPISPASTATSGLGADAGLLEAYALAVDSSGNIWISNQGSNTITKFIGLASPVKTPLSGLPKQP